MHVRTRTCDQKQAPPCCAHPTSLDVLCIFIHACTHHCIQKQAPPCCAHPNLHVHMACSHTVCTSKHHLVMLTLTRSNSSITPADKVNDSGYPCHGAEACKKVIPLGCVLQV
eukprot:1160631-Pelagomonas_calceolata.AAC.6